MKKIIRNKKAMEGQALIMAMIFLLALTFLGFGLVTVATIDVNASRNLRIAEEVLYTAEQGVLMGMAYASDPATGFSSLQPGDSVEISSLDTNPAMAGNQNGVRDNRDPLQYETKIIMRGLTQEPEGEMIDPDIGYVLIEVQSTGYVSENPGGSLFDFNDVPRIRRNVQVMARLRIQLKG